MLNRRLILALVAIVNFTLTVAFGFLHTHNTNTYNTRTQRGYVEQHNLNLFNRISIGFSAGRFAAPRRHTAIYAGKTGETRQQAEVGDMVLAEVDDIGGTVSSPTVTFKIIGRDGPFMASMSAKSLSPTEKLALQAGTMLRVVVTRVDGGKVEVSMGQSKPSGSMTMTTPPSKTTNRMYSAVVQTEKKTKTTPSRVARSPPGILLNNLKCGMKLEGRVSSCTQYAAFISMEPKISRASKGGSYAEVTGLLHETDMLDYKPETMMMNGKKLNVFKSSTSEQILQKDAKVITYVKEVWKNSGRFTLTLDPTVDKSKVLEVKASIKSQGQERRRARRLRRQLESVAVGDLINGIVQNITDDGVLVTVTSLGPLNITGMLGRKDLPKQFEVPPDLKANFQRQLLQQDFIIGRTLKCGVVKIFPRMTTKAPYNLKLLFEEFGPLISLEVDPLDAALKNININDNDSMAGQLEAQTSEQDKDEDGDVREIFDELCAGKTTLPVDDFKCWSDILDMIEEEEFDTATLDSAIESVGAKDSLDFDQFSEVLEILQDALDGIDLDDEDDEGEGEEDITDQVLASLNPNMHELPSDDDEDADDENNDVDDDDDVLEEIARELFDELRGDDKTLKIKQFKAWSDVQDMLSANVITPAQLNDGIVQVGAKLTGDLSFTQFLSLVKMLDELALATDESVSETETLPNGRGFGSSDSKEELKDDDDTMDISSEDLQGALSELYTELKGTNSFLSVKDFKAWDDLQEMIEMELIDDEVVSVLLKKAGVSKNVLTLDQFTSIVSTLDDIGNSLDESDGESDESIGEEVDEEVNEEVNEADERDEEEATMLDAFNELKGDKDVITLKSLLQWEDLKAVIDEGLISSETVLVLLEEVGMTTKKTISLDQFKEFVRLLEETVEATGNGEGNEGNYESDEDEEDDEDLDELSDSEFEEIANEVFETLKGKNNKVSVKKLMSWDDLKEMITDGMITKADVGNFVIAAGSTLDGDLDLKQFIQVFYEIDKATSYEDEETDESDNEENEGEEEVEEVFSELKGSSASLSSKAFYNWEDVREIIKLGIMKKSTLDTMMLEVGVKKGGDVSLTQFKQLFSLIEEAMSTASEGVGDDMDDGTDEVDEGDEDEPTEEELEQMALEIFDELRGKKKTVSIKKLKAWEGITEAISSGMLTKTQVDKVFISFSKGESNEIDFTQFKEIMDTIEDLIDSGSNVESSSPSSNGKGFGKQKPITENNDIENSDEVARELYDDLKGKKKTLSVEKFKAWEDVAEMIENGAIKRSTLEKAIVKVGSYESGEMSFEQFSSVIDIIQKNVDPSKLTLDEETEDIIPVSKKSKVLNLEDDEKDEEDDDEDDETIDEESAQMIFDELRGKDKQLSVVKFLQWEDVQDLLESGALTSDVLASCIEKTGISVDKNGKSNSDLSFETFFDLLTLLDEYIDRSKLPEDEDEESSELIDLDTKKLGELKQMMKGEEFLPPSNPKASKQQMKDEDEDEEDDDFVDDAEVLEMFNEISKGKETITTKQLMKWDEVRELISSELVSKEIIEAYIKRLELKQANVLTLQDFSNFIRLLDEVLVDESGNILAEGGIDLDAFDDEDEGE